MRRRRPPPLRKVYAAIAAADHAIKTAPPGRKLAMRKHKQNVVTECLRAEMKGAINV